MAEEKEKEKSERGFAAMDPEKQREIARKGGQASGGNPENLEKVDRSEAGRKGGEKVVEKYGPEHMAEIGKKGGEARSEKE
jgi:general stress protein YciG